MEPLPPRHVQVKAGRRAALHQVSAGSGVVAGRGSQEGTLHYNYKYDWLRPTLDEIITAYKKLYGKQQPKSNAEDSSGEDSEDQEKGEEGEQEAGEAGEAEDDDEE